MLDWVLEKVWLCRVYSVDIVTVTSTLPGLGLIPAGHSELPRVLSIEQMNKDGLIAQLPREAEGSMVTCVTGYMKYVLCLV